MKHFTTDGPWGTLLPCSSGLRSRIPTWTLLVVAIPLLVLAVVATIAQVLPMQFLFGIPGLLFLIAWGFSRRTPKDAGLLRLNSDTTEAIITEHDGSEVKIRLGGFVAIKLERVLMPRGYIWRAVLNGKEASVVLEMGFFKRSLSKWISPVASWLTVPVETSSEKIRALESVLNPNSRLNPYPGRTSSEKPNRSQKA